MQLMIMRHGDAEPNFRDDQNRNLTTQGMIEVQKAGVWLHSIIQQVDYALVSPYVRAQQTFELMSDFVEVYQSETTHEVIPSGSASTVHEYVDALVAVKQNVDSMLIVSHMPLVSYLLDNFCGHFESRLFSTSGIAVLDYDVSKRVGVITDFYTPE